MPASLNVAQILREHVRLEVESLDRMYLNVYVPALQHAGGVVRFFHHHRGQPFASSVLMQPMSRDFVARLEQYARDQHVPLLTFARDQRKDDVAAEYRARATQAEGVLFIGKAQEKANVFRTEKRRNPQTGQTYPWIVRSTALVNHYYIYALDRDFGPFFLKFNSYFPYTAKLCLNGHEYAKRQLTLAGIAYAALDNGFLSCAQPEKLQAICTDLSAERIAQFARKWLDSVPQAFTPADQEAGYRYELSVLQVECALTQVLDRPLTGRVFFEEVIRENLDLGRPEQVQLIFERRVTKRTPGRFRTRVITEGVTPTLHIDYKHSRIKQYHKEGRALRTETTINNALDFAIGKRLINLPALRQIGFQANRRLLDVQTVSHDCHLGEAAFQQVNQPLVVGTQRVAALRFADPRVQALLHSLLLFATLPRGFANRDLRPTLAALQGLSPDHLTAGRMSYDLRRLRLHGLIERIAGSHRYRLSASGLRVALFFSRTYARLLRPGLSDVLFQSPPAADDSKLRRAFDQASAAIDDLIQQAQFAAA
jgi:hypothetical protein